MIIKQLSVFLENRAGRLAEITGLLSEGGVNIRALSIADTTHFGVLRFIADEPEQAQAVLRQNAVTVSQTDVIAVCVDDQPGGLSGVLGCLAQRGMQVEYLYAFVSREQGKAGVILRMAEECDLREAARVLTDLGYTGLTT